MFTKQILAATLASVLAASFAAPSGARALSADGFEYTVTDSTVTVTGCVGGTCPVNLVIPYALAGWEVTAVAASAFANQNLASVSIPFIVVSIGDSAFLTNNLGSVRLPFSLRTLGAYAFANNNLTAVVIPSGVTTIGQGAFESNSLASVRLNDGLVEIGSEAFLGNTLTTVSIPDSVTGIGGSAFAVNGLSNLRLGDGIYAIGPEAFAYNDLTSVVIPNSVAGINVRAFASNRLTAVSIPGSVVTIANGAFADNDLTTVTFLGNAPDDGGNVFDGNNGLASVKRSYSATRWGSTWGGKTVVIEDARAAATVKPTVAGTTRVGRVLTARGTWVGYPTPTLTYQWYACTKAVTVQRSTVPSTCKKITGATRSTFKLTSAQRGKYVAVLVKGTSLRTTGTTWLSTTTAKVR